MTLEDITELMIKYVPMVARHPNSIDSDGWWPAHELGHLLTTERERHRLPVFGLDGPLSPNPSNLSEHERACRELAAMDVSRRLLSAAGRRDLCRLDRLETSLYWRDRGRVRRILRQFGVERLPRDRTRLEAFILARVGSS